MSSEFRVILDEIPNSPSFNMATDESIFINYIKSSDSVPVLRLYTWQPPTVSIGYFQNASEINLELCRNQNIGFVRRPTGGRSVLHDIEITYSFTGGNEKIFKDKSLLEIYSVISSALVSGLKSAGFNVEFKKPSTGNEKYHTRVLCFDAVSYYEITLNEKKVVGSAQVRKKDMFLQHGSIILKLDKEKTAGLLKVKDKKILDKASGLLDEMPVPDFSVEVFREKLVNGFAGVLDMTPLKSRLTESELELTGFLDRNKYSKNEWNIHCKEPENEKIRV